MLDRSRTARILWRGWPDGHTAADVTGTHLRRVSGCSTPAPRKLRFLRPTLGDVPAGMSAAISGGLATSLPPPRGPQSRCRLTAPLSLPVTCALMFDLKLRDLFETIFRLNQAVLRRLADPPG